MIYNSILRQIAITVNALVGAQPAALQTTYATVPLASANFQSSVFPFLYLVEKMLNAQEGLFMAVASTANQPLRAFIQTQTNALTYGDEITVDAAGLPVVGTYGAVRDVTNGQPLTLNEIEEIQAFNINPNGMFRLPVYQYALLGNRVFPTRPSVIVEVCAYERPNADALDLSSEILLPDILGPAMVQGAIAECFRDDEYLPQSARAAEFYQAWIAAIQKGMTNIEPQTNPTPDAQKAYARA